MELKKFENVPCVWKPIKGMEGVHYSKFVNKIEEKYKVKIGSYWDLHKWSVQNIDKFWEEIWYFVGIKYSRNFTQVIDLSVPMSDAPKWFIGAKLSLAENMLRHKDDHVALIGIGEDRDKRVITYAQLYEEVKRYAAAFRKCGLKKGDGVFGYMSNREEAFFALLGANAVGAVWIGILPLFGAEPVLERLKLVNPSFIITVDRMRYNGEEYEMLSKVKEISEGLPNLVKVIIVPTKPDSVKKDITGISKSCFLDEFLSSGREKDGTIPEIVFEQMNFFDPVIISYTSGTTGPPKALVHDHGCLLSSARDWCLMLDFNRNTVDLMAFLPGWASWFLKVFTLYNGSTNVLFDGVPYFLSPTYLWDLVDEYKINLLILAPSTLDELEKKGYAPTKEHKLSSLFAVVTGTSIAKLHNFDFVRNNVKPGIIFASVYGSTEIMGSCLSFNRSLPVYKGEISCPALGADMQVMDDTGKAVEGITGELVVAKPMPPLPLGMVGDVDGTKYKKTYFSKYSDKFAMGDFALINPITKGIIIQYRSDEVLKPGVWRFGSVEIYNIVNLLPEVHDSLCVSQYSKNRNERAVLFLKVKEGFKFTDALVKKVEMIILEKLTRYHVPSLIMEVKEIPYNINGKKMEVLVKKIINNMPYSSDDVMNKESLQCFQHVPPYED